MTPILCDAIRSRAVLEFEYDGRTRIVHPYCHGTSTRGSEVLRAVQVGGTSRSGGLGIGKLWLVEKIQAARTTGETFSPDDPHYNPNDMAMKEIHCRI